MDRSHCKESIKSIWVRPWENEAGAPEHRIIHGKYVKFAAPSNRARVGVKWGEGYFKCGSETAMDWIVEFAAYQWVEEDWKQVLHITGLQKPVGPEEIVWFDLPETSAACLLEARKSGIDGWWPCYNIAKTGFVVETDGGCMEPEDAVAGSSGRAAKSSPVRRLHRVKQQDIEARVSCEADTSVIAHEADTSGMPHGANASALECEGVTTTRTSVRIRFETPHYQVGFRLKSAGLEFLGLDGTGRGNTDVNLLALGAALIVTDDDDYTQGPVLNPITGPSVCGFLSYDMEGTTEVCGNFLTYRFRQERLGLTTELRFTMKRKSIQIDIRREVEKDVKLLDSSPFRIAFDARKVPLTALGSTVVQGETGALALPLLLCLPGYASVGIEGDATVRGRFNSIRPKFINTFGFEAGEVLCEDGCHLLRQGEYSGSVVLTMDVSTHIRLQKDTPMVVQEAFARYLYASLPFRADTATFSNNGNSMGAPICMDLWAQLCTRIGKGPFGVDAMAFLKSTLEIHLQGAPAYAAGTHASGAYEYEDEYIMTGTSVLLGLAVFLEQDKQPAWYETYKSVIHSKIRAMMARDLDGDGLVESTRRRGVSGEHQWSTNWYDVISYGYKDAFSNALLYPAVQLLSQITSKYGDAALSQELAQWADRIRSVYARTFLTENGWLAGWKCMEGKLHDFGFLAANGAAVSAGLLEKKQARGVMEKLWMALRESGFDSFDMGLPGNVFPIDISDMALVQMSLPFGGYENGGITLSQSRHFINGLRHVGMEAEADFLLTEICKGMTNGSVFGGVGSGVDWKFWDGVSSGYEGLLSDQLGIFEPLINRYGEP